MVVTYFFDVVGYSLLVLHDSLLVHSFITGVRSKVGTYGREIAFTFYSCAAPLRQLPSLTKLSYTYNS